MWRFGLFLTLVLFTSCSSLDLTYDVQAAVNTERSETLSDGNLRFPGRRTSHSAISTAGSYGSSGIDSGAVGLLLSVEEATITDLSNNEIEHSSDAALRGAQLNSDAFADGSESSRRMNGAALLTDTGDETLISRHAIGQTTLPGTVRLFGFCPAGSNDGNALVLDGTQLPDVTSRASWEAPPWLCTWLSQRKPNKDASRFSRQLRLAAANMGEAMWLASAVSMPAILENTNASLALPHGRRRWGVWRRKAISTIPVSSDRWGSRRAALSRLELVSNTDPTWKSLDTTAEPGGQISTRRDTAGDRLWLKNGAGKEGGNKKGATRSA
eukprot:TRINITY_DN833_c0_g1_i1.p1 TRINITY_DN833_c0_g1~~TRINITY_DN833_c0_g1_i1.p1  ORF type:complete len:326 (+),score=21.97 TRINITY_DN833_c0_g1_i1:288-1265(+)